LPLVFLDEALLPQRKILSVRGKSGNVLRRRFDRPETGEQILGSYLNPAGRPTSEILPSALVSSW
jgi:hypothetical protein